MNTLDQVILLQNKVESAVNKIQQLQAENDALRNKCEQLTNALSAKSEQLSSYQTDNSEIENGIQKALDRLNSIENSILKRDGQAAPLSNQKQNPNNNPEEDFSNPAVQIIQDFDSMDNLENPKQNQSQNFQSVDSMQKEDSLDENNSEFISEDENFENNIEDNSQDEDLGFDIF